MKRGAIILPVVATLMGASTAAIAADGSDMSAAIKDVVITNNIPDVNVTVRNVSNSADPAKRDLRAVSAAPKFHVAGQVWCKTLSKGPAHALRAQAFLGNVSLHSTNNGVDALTLGAWAHSSPKNFSGSRTLENFSLDLTAPMQTSWNGEAVVLGFNPAYIVEKELREYLAQHPGGEADFLREDAVFEMTIGVNAVGWCVYDGYIPGGTYAGYRRVDVTARVFYKGDPKIADQPKTVGADKIAPPEQPSRARRRLAPGQEGGDGPPAKGEKEDAARRDR